MPIDLKNPDFDRDTLEGWALASIRSANVNDTLATVGYIRRDIMRRTGHNVAPHRIRFVARRLFRRNCIEKFWVAEIDGVQQSRPAIAYRIVSPS